MRNTNMIKQSFEYFLDLSTDDQKATIVKIKAGGSYVKSRLLPFFTAFKYYKLGSVKVQMVPASTLPVDPTGLSYEAGESTVDPRDMMNPGLVRITNGEDMCPDDARIEQEAYQALICDPRWFKFRLNSGFRRKAVPLYWTVGQLHQDVFPGAIQNRPLVNRDISPGLIQPDNVALYGTVMKNGDALTVTNHPVQGFSDPRGLFQTGIKGKLGWMPTDFDYKTTYPGVSPETSGIAPVPEVELLTFILPQAYKTKFYYRLYIQETVYFKGPVANFVSFDATGQAVTDMPANGIDRALAPSMLSNRMDGYAHRFGPYQSPVPNQGQGEVEKHNTEEIQ